MAITSDFSEDFRGFCTRELADGEGGQERIRVGSPHSRADWSRRQRAYCLPLSLQTRPTIAHRPIPRSGSRCTHRTETLAVSREFLRRQSFEIQSVRSSYICQSFWTSQPPELELGICQPH